MQKEEVHEEPITRMPSVPEWAPPPSPPISGRDRVMMLYERFGFLAACLLTLGVLVVLFIKSDVLLREPDTTPSPVVAEEPPASTNAPGALSVTTEPASAAVFIDGEFVGVSPLQDHALATGAHRISVQKQDYASRDTVVTLAGDPAVLQLALRAVQEEELVDESQEDLPEEPSPELAADTNPETPPPVESSTSAIPAPAEAQPATPADAIPVAQEETRPAAEDDDTALAVEEQAAPLDGEEESPEPEEPVVEVGTMQVLSQPSGAAVWLGDQQVGRTPLLLTEVAVGAQQVTLRLDGYEPFSAVVDVAPQEQSELNGRLTQRLGTLKILAKPWGNIYIDGELRQREASIWYTVQLPPGDYRVRVEHPALGKWEQVVVVPVEPEKVVEVDFNEGTSSSQ